MPSVHFPSANRTLDCIGCMKSIYWAKQESDWLTGWLCVFAWMLTGCVVQLTQYDVELWFVVWSFDDISFIFIANVTVFCWRARIFLYFSFVQRIICMNIKAEPKKLWFSLLWYDKGINGIASAGSGHIEALRFSAICLSLLRVASDIFCCFFIDFSNSFSSRNLVVFRCFLVNRFRCIYRF